MQQFKFACYVASITLCCAAAGLFVPFLCLFLFFGHTTLALFEILRINPAVLTVVFVILGAALDFRIAWIKGRARYFAEEIKQL